MKKVFSSPFLSFEKENKYLLCSEYSLSPLPPSLSLFPSLQTTLAPHSSWQMRRYAFRGLVSRTRLNESRNAFRHVCPAACRTRSFFFFFFFPSFLNRFQPVSNLVKNLVKKILLLQMDGWMDGSIINGSVYKSINSLEMNNITTYTTTTSFVSKLNVDGRRGSSRVKLNRRGGWAREEENGRQETKGARGGKRK